MSFTPGPWAAGEPAWYRGKTDPTAGKRPITAGDQGVIANVYGEGNARLIAAAPELLEALRLCRAIIGCGSLGARLRAEPEAIAKAEAAIAKAEGQS